ncbi:acetamidase/formamidase family protein [uncultured Methylobacterium sp.]|uniref:acetamidase/formamidase family protein n=1 Tax=uncultured Methylobacterium sp. TaxID=157278 RepID=UPI0035C9DFBC
MDTLETAAPRLHDLKATPETIQWGAFDAATEPVCRIRSGDFVTIECLTHHAGDAPDLLMDDAIRRIYDAVPPDQRAPGVHIVTGPIHVEGAEPGDTLECRALSFAPRLRYGSNFLANWGLLHGEFGEQERVFIYEADVETGVARAVFQYAFKPEQPAYPGMVTPVDAAARMPALKNIAVPLRLHFGTAGVCPAADGKVSTVPPGPHGGNVDNREFIAGTSMHYPVYRTGALFWAGDTHFAEGDGEVSGTAIEAHVNATVQFILHKGSVTRNPMLDTPTLWMCHGFHEDLDEAVREATLEMIGFLVVKWGITREEAYSLCSVAGDLRVTQVVDGVKGAHIAIRKDLYRP